MAADDLLLPWLDEHAKETSSALLGAAYEGLAARTRRGDFAPALPTHQAEHEVHIAHHGPSANAPDGHYSWMCTLHQVGTVGNTIADIAHRVDEHLRPEVTS